MNEYRTHNCNEITLDDVGKQVKISGWVQTIRDLGGLVFLDIRDMYGITQVVTSGKAEDVDFASHIPIESTVTVYGTVKKRDEETINPKLKTGLVEIRIEDIKILGKRTQNLPFEVNTNQEIREDLRLQYRFLDLRSDKLKNNLKVSKVDEISIDKTADILSYEDKYISGGKKTGGAKQSMNAGVLKLPANISEELKEKIQTLAKETFKILGCTGVIRIDFLIDEDTDNVYVNEVNTIPGCLSFHLWRAAGMEYPELLDKEIELALKRNREENNMVFSFDTNVLEGYANGGLKGGKGKLEL